MAKTPEGDVKKIVKRIVLDVIKSFGALVHYHMHVPSGYGTNGAPDFTVCACGLYIAIETKRSAKTPLTPGQVKWRKEFIRAGGHYYIIHNANTHEVSAILGAALHGYPLPASHEYPSPV